MPSASTDRKGSGEADNSPRGRPLSGPGPRSRYAENSDGSPVRRRRYRLPRVAIERRLEPARQVRLVDVAALDVAADGLHAGLVLGAAEARVEGQGRRRGARPVRVARPSARPAAMSRAWTSSSRRASRRASPSRARPPSQAKPVRRSKATTQSCRASRSGGRSWSGAAMAGRRSSVAAEVVAEEPDEPAQEARRIRRARSASRPAGRPGSGRPRTGPGPAAGDSRTAIGSAVR